MLQRFSGRSRPRQAVAAGAVLVYSYFILLFMFVMISLAVNVGHLQSIKTEPQRRSDATARGSIQNYITYGGTYALSYAATLASKNSVDSNSGISPSIVTNWGWWNSAAGTFVAGYATTGSASVNGLLPNNSAAATQTMSGVARVMQR